MLHRYKAFCEGAVYLDTGKLERSGSVVTVLAWDLDSIPLLCHVSSLPHLLERLYAQRTGVRKIVKCFRCRLNGHKKMTTFFQSGTMRGLDARKSTHIQKLESLEVRS